MRKLYEDEITDQGEPIGVKEHHISDKPPEAERKNREQIVPHSPGKKPILQIP